MISNIGRSRIDSVASNRVCHARFDNAFRGFLARTAALLRQISSIFASTSDDDPDSPYSEDRIAEWMVDPNNGGCSPVKY